MSIVTPHPVSPLGWSSEQGQIYLEDAMKKCDTECQDARHGWYLRQTFEKVVDWVMLCCPEYIITSRKEWLFLFKSPGRL